MKSLLVVLLAAGSLSLSAGITTTKHNLASTSSAAIKATNTNQICVFCHTPHNSALGAAQLVPLWNKAPDAAGAFTLYTSATLVNTPGQPTGASLACMTCHDGSVSMASTLNKPYDAPGGVTLSGGTLIDATGKLLGGATGSLAFLGTNLSVDHPVSMTYPSAAQLAVGGALNGKFLAAPAGNARLFATKVECASCHSVHDNTNAPFLRDTMAASALCLDCHTK